MQFECTCVVVIDNAMSMYDGLRYGRRVTCRLFLENIAWGLVEIMVLFVCWVLIGFGEKVPLIL